MWDLFLLIVLCGMASGVISTTITQSKLFRWVRQAIITFQPAGEDGEPWFLGELITCPYCFGHWVALVFMLNIGYSITTWFAITAVSVITSGVIGKLYAD